MGAKKAKGVPGTTAVSKGRGKKVAGLGTAQPVYTMDSFLSGSFRGGGRRKAVDEAQALMYDAWEAPTRKRALELCQKALEVSADCADAYVMLAQKAHWLQEAVAIYRRGVAAGERAIGKKAFKENVGYFWGILETRPYMRALQGLAMTLWEDRQREEAVEHFWELLRLNPDDNQGNRDLFMPRLIELGRDEDAERLYKQYKEDGMAVWRYARALLDFRKRGDSSVSEKSLRAALKHNPHVPAYVLDRKKMPRYLPGHYGVGDENEAVGFAFENKAAWKATPGALEWLAATAKAK